MGEEKFVGQSRQEVNAGVELTGDKQVDKSFRGENEGSHLPEDSSQRSPLLMATR